ncbi:hypothetical protein [Campylobacter sp. 19-13652]|uniref:hypothetical protein n=1 Tax=Campylobacter sp. 19-13652 TaxID=2840180 RepID=UPI001C77F46B|nr:hypothetical protein [Campylobacter sp. 19-13652]BCX80135.1 hypothetical protein LBC_15970 [Campylobacter sp. 19-13652]
MSIRLVPAMLEVCLELDAVAKEQHLMEYNSLSFSEEDPLGAWLKRARAKGETKNTDEVLLNLLVHLHRKIDVLSEAVSGVKREFKSLAMSAIINEVGFEYVGFGDEILSVDEKYYMRFELPVFPKRQIAMYLKACDKRVAKIELMHDDDVSDWDGFVASKEREMIRMIKNGG